MLPWLIAGAAVLVAVSALLAWGGQHRRARHLAEDVKVGIEPYLRRKAAEAGMPAAAPTWTPRATPEQIVGHSARLAAQLLELERNGPPSTTTKDLELAKTQPVSDADFVITGKQTGRR